MMKGLLNGLHPSFEALSALADRDANAARTGYVGRHVAECAQCQADVTDIRNLGDSARALDCGGPPDDLWNRIVESGTPNAALEPAVIMSEPASRKRSRRVGLLALLAAAAAIVAVMGWPSGRSLQATGLSRLTFSPGRPRPGSELSVRYIPSPFFKGAPRLILVGKPLRGTSVDPAFAFGRADPGLGDSLATLRLARDGSYEARFRLPADFQALELSVTDSAGSRTDVDGLQLWRVIGGRPDGGPSLPAFLAAGPWEQMADCNGCRLGGATQTVNVADSLRRYFPDHPAGWAFSRDYTRKKGIFSFLGYFQSAERRYAILNDRLTLEPVLDAEHLADMAAFARNIEEPEEAFAWTKRLVREHPDDPRSMPMLAEALHELEVRQPAHFADSIRQWLPLLDSLYRRRAQTGENFAEELKLADRYGDSATRSMWGRRLYDYSDFPYYSAQWSVEAMLREAPPGMFQKMREGAEAYCAERPAGRFPMIGTAAGRLVSCNQHRARLLHTLSSVALFRGEARSALVLADSAERLRGTWTQCTGGRFGPSRIIGWARLALRDTVGAERAFVQAYGVAQTAAGVDSVRRALGKQFDEVRWKARADSASRLFRACVAGEEQARGAARRAGRWRD